MPVNFPGQTYKTAAQVFAIPQQNVKVLDQDLASGSLNMAWLLWDGGMRKGLREQAARQRGHDAGEARRTDLEIADSVTRMYWGAVLARQLRQLGGTRWRGWKPPRGSPKPCTRKARAR